MIYTSYFRNLRKIQKCSPNIVPISIAGKSPDWFTGIEYRKLAPKIEFFRKWKVNHDNNFYIREYYKQVLSELNPQTIAKELYDISNQNDIVLLCYEKPGEFCHRHLVKDWLSEVTLVEEICIKEGDSGNGNTKNNRNYRRCAYRK